MSKDIGVDIPKSVGSALANGVKAEPEGERG